MESVAFVKERIVLGTESNVVNFTHADIVIAFPFESVNGFNATVPVWVVPGNCRDIVPNLESVLVVATGLVPK
jgi:voltage-gated potassium channel Kch